MQNVATCHTRFVVLQKLVPHFHHSAHTFPLNRRLDRREDASADHQIHDIETNEYQTASVTRLHHFSRSKSSRFLCRSLVKRNKSVLAMQTAQRLTWMVAYLALISLTESMVRVSSCYWFVRRENAWMIHTPTGGVHVAQFNNLKRYKNLRF